MTGTINVGDGSRALTERPWLFPLMRVLNAGPRWILRSPLHGVMSGSLALLEIKGRNSGQTHSIPVSYVTHAGAVLIGTDRPWKRNVQTGDSVGVWLKGRKRVARAEATEDAAEVTRLFGIILPENRPLGRFLGIGLGADGLPHHDDMQRALDRGVVVIQLYPD